MVARDLWTNDELRLHQIADNTRSRSQAQRDVFESSQDLEKIELLKSLRKFI
jgi:hypothetical protein